MGGDGGGLDDVGLDGEDGERERRSDEGEGRDETAANDEFLWDESEKEVSVRRAREFRATRYTYV